MRSRAFGTSPAVHAAEVKSLGVIGAGQMVVVTI
jgi:3-hydroxybutyryl-CoA dehydrogenase